MTQFSMTFHTRSTVMDVYAQSMSIVMPKSTEATIAIAVKSMASPASTQATGNPVNTNRMKAKNIANASISLAGMEEEK